MKYWLSCLLFAVALPCMASDPARPNIVFILADDLGINDLACYGRREHRTPHLDRLAQAGARFTASYCAQPICSPSRAAILTGHAPARLHLTTYLPGRPDCASQKLSHPTIRQALPLAEQTLAEYLKAAGYRTACIGKWHLGGKGFGPLEQGFEIYHAGKAVTQPSDTEGGKGEYDLTERAEEFITANKDGPFFLYLAHNSPHIPYSARTNLVTKNKAALEPVYAAVIETLDATVGQLLARIDKLGLASNTIVIFTSDNGGLHVPEGPHRVITQNGVFRAGKGFLYEGGLRVPLIIRWQGKIPAGLTVDAPMINTDWLPTVLEWAGVAIPSGLDGVSMAFLARGEPARSDRALFWHFPHYTNQGSQPGGAVRRGKWKLIEDYTTGRIEIYDLSQDPGETVNLGAREVGIGKDLKAELAAWREALSVQTNSLNPYYQRTLGAQIYEEVDVSRYNAARANASERSAMLNWRRQMNAVVPKAR